MDDPLRGRGGERHKYLQKLITQLGHELGFRATIEAQIPGTGGRVDVLLEHESHTIACEISVTTSTRHEMGNITKCLSAGYTTIALLVEDERCKKTLTDRAEQQLSTEDSGRVSIFTPDEFIAFLDQEQQKHAPQTKKVRGWNVNVTYAQLPV